MPQPIVPAAQTSIPVPAPDEASLALAADLEAALEAALAEGSEAETDVPSVRQQRLARALALANEESVEHLSPLPPVPAVGNTYAAMLASYGAFPTLLPAGRDFRLTLILSVLFGFLGADRFYERKYATGVLKLATLGGLGLWWVADIISILTGRAQDKNGQPFTGAKKHRIIAWALTAALFAGLVPAAAAVIVPAVTARVTAVNSVLFPQPAPVPTWAVLAEATGDTEPIVLDITGERLRLTYNFPGAVYAYLQKESSAPVPADTVILKEIPTQGQSEMVVSPGRYHLIVRTEGTPWTLKAEELGLHG